MIARLWAWLDGWLGIAGMAGIFVVLQAARLPFDSSRFWALFFGLWVALSASHHAGVQEHMRKMRGGR